MALFINRFPLFCPAILEQRSRQRPRTRPFVLDKTERKPYNLLKHIAGTSDLVFCLPRVGVQKGACGTPPSSRRDGKPGARIDFAKQNNQNEYKSSLFCGRPKRGAKRHISSKVSVAELYISSGRKPTYRARHSLAYRHKFLAGTKN